MALHTGAGDTVIQESPADLPVAPHMGAADTVLVYCSSGVARLLTCGATYGGWRHCSSRRARWLTCGATYGGRRNFLQSSCGEELDADFSTRISGGSEDSAATESFVSMGEKAAPWRLQTERIHRIIRKGPGPGVYIFGINKKSYIFLLITTWRWQRWLLLRWTNRTMFLLLCDKFNDILLNI